jgi:hypothetical protein
MIEIVLVDDNDRFGRALQRAYQSLVKVFPVLPQKILTDCKTILLEHPDADVFIDLYPRAGNAHATLENGVALAKMAQDFQKNASRLHVCGHDSPEELPDEIRKELSAIGVEYIQKSEIKAKIEQMMGSPRRTNKNGGRPSVLRDPDIRKQYAGQVIAVLDRHVWGAGASFDAALKTAGDQPGCPPLETLKIFLVPEGEQGDLPYLSPPQETLLPKVPRVPLAHHE